MPKPTDKPEPKNEEIVKWYEGLPLKKRLEREPAPGTTITRRKKGAKAPIYDHYRSLEEDEENP